MKGRSRLKTSLMEVRLKINAKKIDMKIKNEERKSIGKQGRRLSAKVG